MNKNRKTRLIITIIAVIVIVVILLLLRACTTKKEEETTTKVIETVVTEEPEVVVEESTTEEVKVEEEKTTNVKESTKPVITAKSYVLHIGVAEGITLKVNRIFSSVGADNKVIYPEVTKLYEGDVIEIAISTTKSLYPIYNVANATKLKNNQYTITASDVTITTGYEGDKTILKSNTNVDNGVKDFYFNNLSSNALLNTNPIEYTYIPKGTNSEVTCYAYNDFISLTKGATWYDAMNFVSELNGASSWCQYINSGYSVNNDQQVLPSGQSNGSWRLLNCEEDITSWYQASSSPINFTDVNKLWCSSVADESNGKYLDLNNSASINDVDKNTNDYNYGFLLVYEKYSNSSNDIIGYQTLDYIKSNGSQYIDTGLNFNSAIDDFEIKYQLLLNGDNGILIGGGDGGSEGGSMYLGNGNFSTLVCPIVYGPGYDQRIEISADSLYTSNNAIHTSKYDHSERNFYLDEEVILSIDTDCNTDYSQYLFAFNDAGTISDKGLYKLFYFKYVKDGQEYNFVPSRRLSDGQIGLLETHNNIFYVNQGVGYFTGSDNIVKTTVSPSGSGSISITYDDSNNYVLTASPNSGYEFDSWTLNNYTRVEYIESNEFAFVPTGIKFPANLDMRIEYTGNAVMGFDAHAGDYFGSENGILVIGGTSTGVDANQINDLQILFEGDNVNKDADGNAYAKLILNNNDVYESSKHTYPNCSSELTLFNMKSKYHDGVSRLYSCKIYKDGTLVRDYVPVRREDDGMLGLYDLLENKFYRTNRGYFVAGEDQGYLTISSNPFVSNLDVNIVANFKVSD